MVKSPKQVYTVSTPKAARAIAGMPYAKYDVDGGIGTANKMLAIHDDTSPKMRIKSPRSRERR